MWCQPPSGTGGARSALLPDLVRSAEDCALLTPVGVNADGNALHWSNRALSRGDSPLICLKEYIKKAEAAQLLQGTPRTVENLVRKGVLSVVRIGGIVRFPAKEFHEALQKYTVNKQSGSSRKLAPPLGKTPKKTKPMALSRRTVLSSPKASGNHKSRGGKP